MASECLEASLLCRGVPDSLDYADGIAKILAVGAPTGDRTWRDTLISPWAWRKAPNDAGMTPARAGEARGYYVESAGLPGVRAYMKPLPIASDGYPRAAREKIVADLAFDLEVCVPPVVLWVRDDASAGEETNVCVSRLLHRTQWSWFEVRPFVIDPGRNQRVAAGINARLPICAAEGLVLDTWVAQVDHGSHLNHDGNIMWGYDRGTTDGGRFIFLDYAWSLGHKGGWSKEGWANVVVPPFPPHMQRFADPTAVAELVTRVENFSDGALDAIVSRIPDTFMADTERRTVLDGLKGRRALIRGILLPATR